MGQVSAVLRRGEGRYFHWCPACEEMHQLPDRWTFDGNVDRPTFTPSFKHGGKRVVVEQGRWTGEWHRGPDGKPLDGNCHYIITAGMIHFCSDSWHGRSDVVPMPEIPTFVTDL
jgi:hypothetical protein